MEQPRLASSFRPSAKIGQPGARGCGWVGFWGGGWPPRGLLSARAAPLTMPRCGCCSVRPSRSRANAHAPTARGDAGQPHATGTSMPTSHAAAASAAVAAAAAA